LHGEKDISFWNEDEATGAQRIHYLTFSKLVRDYSDWDHQKNYFIIDEFEQILVEETFSLVDSGINSSHMMFKYNVNFFDKVKLFGFTGSYSEVA